MAIKTEIEIVLVVQDWPNLSWHPRVLVEIGPIWEPLIKLAIKTETEIEIVVQDWANLSWHPRVLV